MIRNKTQMFDILTKGGFGNTIRMWSPLEIRRIKDPPDFFHLRYVGVYGGGPLSTGVPYSKLEAKIEEWISQGHNPEKIVIGEDPNDELRTIQGEVGELNGTLCLRYTNVRVNMRDAFKQESIEVTGLSALTILQSYLSASFYEDIMALLDLYKGHVVEFSAFSTCIGFLRGHNGIIWEVRYY
jgi:hypothetical protein